MVEPVNPEVRPDLNEALEKLRDLSERATGGPWEARCFMVKGGDGLRDTVTHTGGNLPPARSQESEANAAFIVACVNFVRAALTKALEGTGHAD